MHLSFFVPFIHHLPTGGNIYNRRIIKYLAQRTDVKVEFWKDNPGTVLVDGKQMGRRTASVGIIDSLLIGDSDRILWLKRRRGLSKLVLVAHYLYLLDPNRVGSSIAEREKRVLDLFDGFVSTSEFCKEALCSVGVSSHKIRVVKPGLDSGYKSPVEFSRRTGSPHVLTVSNMLPGKGLIEFIDVLEAIGKLSWVWEVVGNSSLDPDYADRFRARVSNSRTAACVQIHGDVDQDSVRQIYDRCHVFALPSHFENSPLVIRESMARGLPVVAYRMGGIPESISNQNMEYLIPPGDRAAFSAALERLLNDEELRISMGRRNARYARRQFPSWDEAGRQFYEFIAEL